MKTIGVVVVLLMIVGLVVSAIEIMLDWWTQWRIDLAENREWTDEEHAMLFGGTGLKRWK